MIKLGFGHNGWRLVAPLMVLLLLALAASALVTAGATAAPRESASSADVAIETMLDDQAAPVDQFTLTAGIDYRKEEPRRVRRATAEQNGLTARTFDRMLRNDSELYVTNDGDLVWADTLGIEQQSIAFSSKALAAATLIPMWPTSQTFGLHSNPGASHTFYLDFDGEASTNPAYPDALPWDNDGDTTTLSDAEHAHIQAIWQEVADDFAAFDVDVTTQRPSSLGYGGSNYHVIFSYSYALHAANCPQDWCAGIASSSLGAALVFARSGWDPHTGAFTATHELGHNLGLAHDGWKYPDGTTETYYKGHGNWTTMMGAGSDRGVSHFATGMYAPTPSNTDEDDLAEITARLGLREDDHAEVGDWANATSFPASSATLVGVIEDRFDTDAFVYDVPCTGTLQVDAYGPEHGPNLDIELSVRNGGIPGGAPTVDNPSTATVKEYPASGLSAAVSIAATADDTWFISIDGVGDHTEGLDGYSDYGSIGGYSVEALTVCDTPSDTTPVVTIDSPAAGTDLDVSSVTATGSVIGAAVPSTVTVTFVESSGAVTTIVAPTAADGTWEATIAVDELDSYDVTASIPDDQDPTSIATTQFSIYGQPIGAPEYLSIVQPARNAEVALPVRLTGVWYDTVGLGIPRLTIQDPDGNYWDGNAFTPTPTELSVSGPSTPAVDGAWEFIFDPDVGVAISPGSYTARLTIGRAVVNSSDYTIFRIGADTTAPTIVKFKRRLGLKKLDFELVDDHGLGSIELLLTDPDGVATAHSIAVDGYHDTATFDFSDLDSLVDYTLEGQVLDAAGNATVLPSLILGAFAGDHSVTVDADPAVPITTQSWTMTGSTASVPAGAALKSLSYVERVHAAIADIGAVQLDPVWGWHLGGGTFEAPVAAEGLTWLTNIDSFGSFPHIYLANVADVYGVDTLGLGTYGEHAYQVDLGEFDLDIRMHLGGARDDASGTMRDDLRVRGVVPATDPYLATATVPASVLAVDGIRAPVDWVLIELRPVGEPTTSVEQIPALLLRDGSVVNVDGFSPVRAAVATGEHFITVAHRNHLPATIRVHLGSRADVNIDLGVSDESGLDGGVGAHQDCKVDPCRLVPGNGVQGGFDSYQINGADKTVWFTANGAFNVYDVGDFDLDADVNGADKIVWSDLNGTYAPLPPW